MKFISSILFKDSLLSSTPHVYCLWITRYNYNTFHLILLRAHDQNIMIMMKITKMMDICLHDFGIISFSNSCREGEKIILHFRYHIYMVILLRYVFSQKTMVSSSSYCMILQFSYHISFLCKMMKCLALVKFLF